MDSQKMELLDCLDDDVVPWSFRQRDMLFTSASSNRLYHHQKKEKKPVQKSIPVESDDAVLCRVAQRIDTGSDTYTLSKKVIEMEQVIEPKKQVVVVRPSEFERYFEQFETRKPPLPKKTIPLEYGPRIPFTPSITEDIIKTVPNPKQDGLLVRSKDSSKITLVTANTSIMEWRKQRMMASMSMKQLKKIFPPTSYTPKKQVMIGHDMMDYEKKKNQNSMSTHPYYSQANQITMGLKSIQIPRQSEVILENKLSKVLAKSNSNLQKISLLPPIHSLSASIAALSLLDE